MARATDNLSMENVLQEQREALLFPAFGNTCISGDLSWWRILQL